MDEQVKSAIDWIFRVGLVGAAGITWRYGGKVLSGLRQVEQLFRDNDENKLTIKWHTKQFRAIYRAFGIPSDFSNEKEIKEELEKAFKKRNIDRLAAQREMIDPDDVETSRFDRRSSVPNLDRRSEPVITTKPDTYGPPPLAAQRRLSTGGHTAWRGSPDDGENGPPDGPDDTGGRTIVGQAPRPGHQVPRPRRK